MSEEVEGVEQTEALVNETEAVDLSSPPKIKIRMRLVALLGIIGMLCALTYFFASDGTKPILSNKSKAQYESLKNLNLDNVLPK